MEEALHDSAIERIEKTQEGYSFWLKSIPIKISIILSVNPSRGGFNFDLSHYIKTPSQIGPYRPSRPWGDSKDYALNLAISSITQYYKQAIKEGHIPTKDWLYPTQYAPLSDPPQLEPNLEPQQKVLYQKLNEEKYFLAKIYIGGLHVLQQKDNPDQLSLAAHSLRELMEKIPLYADIRIKPPVSLGAKVREIYDIWKCMGPLHQKDETIKDTGKDNKKITKQIDSFFEWYENNIPTRNEQLRETLRELDSSRSSVPDELEKINIKIWDTIRTYFVKLAHHNNMESSREEFKGYLSALERFLLDRIKPRTFEDFEEIDALIGVQTGNDKQAKD